MAKKLIGRQDLERLALQEIRSFPGGEFVLSVEIEYRLADSSGTNWTMFTYVDGGSSNSVERAVETTRDRLQQHYNLRLD